MKTKINLFITVLIFLLIGAGCSARIIQTESISSQTASTPTSSEPPLTITNPNLSTTETPEPDIEQKYTYFLDQAAIGQFCLEFPMLTVYKAKDMGDQFLVGVLEHNNISVVSPENGVLTPMFTPEFSQGHLLMIDYEYPWYGYMMVDSPNGLGKWNFHIVNLETGSNTIVADRDLFNSIPLHVYTAIDAGVVYLSASTFEDGFTVETSKVYAIDLTTNETSLVIDSSETDTFMSLISASNGYLLIENDPPKDQQALHLSLYDIAGQSRIDLPQKYPASMPGMEYPYLIWKNSNRFEEPFSFTVYNMETGISVVREITGRDAYDPIVSNGFAITQASTGKDRTTNSVILYSLDGGEVYAIKIGIDNIFAADAYIDQGNVIFNFRETADSSDFSSYLCKIPLETVISGSHVGIEE
jgi:hypothetical protein